MYVRVLLFINYMNACVYVLITLLCCAYTCMHNCNVVCTCIYMSVMLYMYISTCTCTCICITIYVYMCKTLSFVHIYVCMCIDVCDVIFECVQICMYVEIVIFIAFTNTSPLIFSVH